MKVIKLTPQNYLSLYLQIHQACLKTLDERVIQMVFHLMDLQSHQNHQQSLPVFNLQIMMSFLLMLKIIKIQMFE